MVDKVQDFPAKNSVEFTVASVMFERMQKLNHTDGSGKTLPVEAISVTELLDGVDLVLEVLNPDLVSGNRILGAYQKLASERCLAKSLQCSELDVMMNWDRERLPVAETSYQEP